METEEERLGLVSKGMANGTGIAWAKLQLKLAGKTNFKIISYSTGKILFFLFFLFFHDVYDPFSLLFLCVFSFSLSLSFYMYNNSCNITYNPSNPNSPNNPNPRLYQA